jgi:hypothetical protein
VNPGLQLINLGIDVKSQELRLVQQRQLPLVQPDEVLRTLVFRGHRDADRHGPEPCAIPRESEQ